MNDQHDANRNGPTPGRSRRWTCSANSILPRWCGRSRSRCLAGRLVHLPEAERVPFGVLARSEPAVARHRRLVLGLAALLLHLRNRRVDVVRVEIDPEMTRLVPR